MPNQKTARECARAVIKNYANPSSNRREPRPHRVKRFALILHALMWQKTRAKRVYLPGKLNFLSRCKREREMCINMDRTWPYAVTTTRHNSKTTIIKANSKEAVCKKRKKNESPAVNERHLVLKRLSFLWSTLAVFEKCAISAIVSFYPCFTSNER